MRALYEGIEAWRRVPFDWPTANCCHFARDMAERQGRRIDLEIPVLSGPEEAHDWLVANGYRTLDGLLRHLFGEPVAPLQAHRGDLVYRLDDAGGSIGVVDRAAYFLGERGLISVPLGQCRFAFRIHNHG